MSYLRRLSAPSIEQLSTEADLRTFVRSIGAEIPLFVGFGLKVIDLEELAKKYRTKAWFAVMENFSDSVMEAFDFDKGPAIVVMRGEYGEKSTFYGPFEGLSCRSISLIVPFLHEEKYSVLSEWACFCSNGVCEGIC